jgi:hypothetical protein
MQWIAVILFWFVYISNSMMSQLTPACTIPTRTVCTSSALPFNTQLYISRQTKETQDPSNGLQWSRSNLDTIYSQQCCSCLLHALYPYKQILHPSSMLWTSSFILNDKLSKRRIFTMDCIDSGLILTQFALNSVIVAPCMYWTYTKCLYILPLGCELSLSF